MESNNRYFQWILGDRRGEVVVFDSIVAEDGEIYITFKDQSRINEKLVAQINSRDLTNKWMAEVDSPSNIWKFRKVEKPQEKERLEQDANTGVNYEIPTADEMAHADLTPGGGVTRPTPSSKRKKIELVPPRPTPASHSVFGKIQRSMTVQEPILPEAHNIQPQTVNTPVQQPVKPTYDTTDPVYILMSKAKKLDTEIIMEMTVALPPKNLYEIAKESFDEGNTKFIDYIVSEITVDEIKEALKIAIKQMYDDSEIKDINS